MQNCQEIDLNLGGCHAIIIFIKTDLTFIFTILDLVLVIFVICFCLFLLFAFIII